MANKLAKRKKQWSDRPISMEELRSIIDREAGTIRNWQKDGRLPAHLLPARDENNHRIWTQQQVFGKDGIIQWMVDNDMRPGRLMANPDNERRHLDNLRKPKYLDGNAIRGIRKMVANGRSREYIINKVYPRTPYAQKKSLEKAIVRYFNRQGWDFPPKAKPPGKRFYPPPHLRMGQPGPKPKPGSPAAKRQAKLRAKRRRLVGY